MHYTKKGQTTPLDVSSRRAWSTIALGTWRCTGNLYWEGARPKRHRMTFHHHSAGGGVSSWTCTHPHGVLFSFAPSPCRSAVDFTRRLLFLSSRVFPPTADRQRQKNSDDALSDGSDVVTCNTCITFAVIAETG